MRMRMRTRLRRKNQSASLPFPRDIMIEILHRLPLKTLLICKRVSKQWKDLINDPIFYKRHTNGRPAFILVRDTLYGLFIRDDFGLEMHPVPIGLKERAPDSSRIPQLLNPGWSNEIACVMAGHGIFLFHNLFTGVSFAVRNAPMRHYCTWFCYGFGYDPHDGGDHKIFVACHDPRQKRDARFQNAENSLFWVYSFSNKGWEQFEGFPDVAAYNDWSCCQSAAISFNGVLHWVVRRRNPEEGIVTYDFDWIFRNVVKREEVIVTYDLHTRRFGEILVPNVCSEILESGKVSESNGLLWYSCMINYGLKSGYKRNFVVWIMNEDSDSWRKVASIDFSLVSELPMEIRCGWDRVEPAALYGLSVLFVCHYTGKMFWYHMFVDEIQMIDDVEAHLLKDKDKEGKLQRKRKRDFS